MGQLVQNFKSIMEEFRNKRHDLLDILHSRLDRDYVEFNVQISDSESALQQFIKQSDASICNTISASTMCQKKKIHMWVSLVE